MKNIFIVLVLSIILLTGCGNTTEPDAELTESNEQKQTEMLEAGVMLYLTEMTNNFSFAYTIATTKEQRNEYLNKAITDINLAAYEIEDKYEEGAPPTNELFELAEKLKLTIDAELEGDSDVAYDYSVETGEIIGQISREYLDGELPTAFKIMTGLDSAN